MTMVLEGRVLPEAARWHEELTQIRRDIHACPELGFETGRTVERIVGRLKAWGVETVDAETVRGGVIAVINGSRPGKTIALRADIDALPMDDCSGNPWASRNEGRAHACGHDGHQTWLLGTLRQLASRPDFPGRVVGIFQPAEEIAQGAKAVVASGVFQKYGIAEIFGDHTEPMLPKGVFGFRTGPLQASSDSFWITIHGKGTHGGRPHLGVDPIPVGAEIVGALQTIVARKVNPIIPAVVSVCSLNAGRFQTPNVVPHFLTMSGTVRTFSEEARRQIERLIREMAEKISEASGCTAEVKYVNQISAVVNAREQTEAGIRTAERLFGKECVVPQMDPFLSSEDFSEYQALVPGSMLRIGVRDEAHSVSVHNQSFDFNDEVLPAAVTLLSEIARDRLETLARA